MFCLCTHLSVGIWVFSSLLDTVDNIAMNAWCSRICSHPHLFVKVLITQQRQKNFAYILEKSMFLYIVRGLFRNAWSVGPPWQEMLRLLRKEHEGGSNSAWGRKMWIQEIRQRTAKGREKRASHRETELLFRLFPLCWKEKIWAGSQASVVVTWPIPSGWSTAGAHDLCPDGPNPAP